MGRIRSWVLYTALAEATDWPTAGGDPPFQVCVSLSARELVDPLLRQRVREMLAATELDWGRLTSLEIAETDVAADPARVVRIAGRLRDMGLRIAIDDVGTAYSALLYVPGYPMDGLQMNGAVLAGIVGQGVDASLVRLVLRLTHELRRAAVEEGAHNYKHRDQLEWVGCDGGRGYLWSPALPPLEVTRWLGSAGAGWS